MMKRFVRMMDTLAVGIVLLASCVSAQSPEAVRVFGQNCMSCHGPASSDRAPGPSTLRQMAPEAIYAALTTGSMRAHAGQLTDDEKRSIAEYLGGRRIVEERVADATRMPNRCPQSAPAFDMSAGPAWNGWGVDTTSGRFQAAKAAGLPADQVPRLKLKWAFGFPGVSAAWGQPTIAGGRIFAGVDTGYVYSLDSASGCLYWSFRAQAGVRNAVSIGPVKGSGSAKYAVYFGDIRANVYAVDAATGALLWKTKADEHSLAGITGAPTLYEDRLYVPVSSREEPAGVSLNYPCCTFRGSVLALDANTGRQIWKTYVIPDAPKPARKNSKGTQLWAPAGGAVWNSPTIDIQRHAVYVGTGNTYTDSPEKTTDAVVAFDMSSGKVLWAAQDLAEDAWLSGCETESPSENCPKNVGPDYDFGSSPILRALPDGRRVLVAGQKSGIVFAHDPDRGGALVWKAILAEKLSRGEITFGGAADERSAYFGVKSGGVAAIEMATGERKWFTPLPGERRSGQGTGETAALTAIPGVVFSGGWDGVLRALSTEDGHLLWEYNTLHEIKTVNGVAARGGSMGGPGPTVAGGMLFATSGYTFGRAGIPGNVLLAFSVQ